MEPSECENTMTYEAKPGCRGFESRRAHATLHMLGRIVDRFIRPHVEGMHMNGTEKQILDELKEIKADLEYIKKHFVDVDLVVTDDDMESVRKAEDDYKKRRTKR